MKRVLGPVALILNAFALAFAFASAMPPQSPQDAFTQAMLEQVRATETACGDGMAQADPSVQALCATTRMNLELFKSTWDSAAQDEARAPVTPAPISEWRYDGARDVHERAYDLAGNLYLVAYAPRETGGELLLTHYTLNADPPLEPLRVTVNWQDGDFPLETRVLIERLFSATGAVRADCTPAAQGADGAWRTACGVLEQPFTAVETALGEALETLPGIVVINPLRQTRAGAYAAGYRFAGREHVLIVQETDQGLDLLLRAAVN